MKFKFLCPVNPPSGIIEADSIRELSVEDATLYAGKAFNHLEPLDAEAKALLSALKDGKSYKPETPKPEHEIKEFTRIELIEIAKALGIKGADAMKKDELSAAIAGAQA